MWLKYTKKPYKRSAYYLFLLSVGARRQERQDDFRLKRTHFLHVHRLSHEMTRKRI